MATEIACWGYTAWRTQRATGYEVSGYVDGTEFCIVSADPNEAERCFCVAARRAWLRQQVRKMRGLPARVVPPVSRADTYHEITLRMLLRALRDVTGSRKW